MVGEEGGEKFMVTLYIKNLHFPGLNWKNWFYTWMRQKRMFNLHRGNLWNLLHEWTSSLVPTLEFVSEVNSWSPVWLLRCAYNRPPTSRWQYEEHRTLEQQIYMHCFHQFPPEFSERFPLKVLFLNYDSQYVCEFEWLKEFLKIGWFNVEWAPRGWMVERV